MLELRVPWQDNLADVVDRKQKRIKLSRTCEEKG